MKEKVYEKKMNKGKEERNKTAMKIALINENSQAAKNELICSVLEKVVVPMGHTVDNYGMYRADDEAQLTYVQAGISAAMWKIRSMPTHLPMSMTEMRWHFPLPRALAGAGN